MMTCECCGANCDSGEIVGGICLDCAEKTDNEKRGKIDEDAGKPHGD